MSCWIRGGVGATQTGPDNEGPDPACWPPLLIFTDLDGTLLEADSYSFAPAGSALERVSRLGIPLIPTTSKTLAEVAALSERLANPHPCIVENGGAICVPEGYPDLAGESQRREGYRVYCQAPTYDRLRGLLLDLRRSGGFRFCGFGDMTDAQVAAGTGLSLAEAARARDRLCSEPLIWQDDDESLVRFRTRLRCEGLVLTRGGRYWHVTGPWDKAGALVRLRDIYQGRERQDRPVTLALGDSPNDREMLAVADIAVVIRGKDGAAMNLEGARVSDFPGPEGWGRMVHRVLDELGLTGGSPRAVGAQDR
jgi:mannosyl-3-phosphoglycerate phosphatase